ncbi:MAG: ATP-binding protein, partial [Actinobacteria bacterium]|nr:ATP-binding protein [Actinomycetota bacterium]
MQDLMDAGLGKVEALIEYRLPYSSQRADVVLAGLHPKTGSNSYLVVELKQWTHARPVDGADDLVLIDAYGARPVLQPLEQVRHYVTYMRDFVKVLEFAPQSLSGVAYLHNGDQRQLQLLRATPESDDARIFFGSERGAWLEFLRSQFSAAAGASAADD